MITFVPSFIACPPLAQTSDQADIVLTAGIITVHWFISV